MWVGPLLRGWPYISQSNCNEVRDPGYCNGSLHPILVFHKRKNGHILPTGQWYAPSAVINDALIMPEHAKVCQSMQEYARVCQSMSVYARVC